MIFDLVLLVQALALTRSRETRKAASQNARVTGLEWANADLMAELE
jgi:hypothetical protein